MHLYLHDVRSVILSDRVSDVTIHVWPGFAEGHGRLNVELKWLRVHLNEIKYHFYLLYPVTMSLFVKNILWILSKWEKDDKKNSDLLNFLTRCEESEMFFQLSTMTYNRDWCGQLLHLALILLQAPGSGHWIRPLDKATIGLYSLNLPRYKW